MNGIWTKRRNVIRYAAVVAAVAGVLASLPAPAFAMHISEGLLPASWAVLWYAVAIPFIALGLRELQRRSVEFPYFKPLVGLVGAAVFLISCMPIP
ncbi:MAG: energy-coupling factor ABC transporter permease, partial [Thermodesulfobacteriota bacterium]